MALTNCKECNGKVSDQAKSCPHCGAPIGIAIKEKVQEYIRKCRHCGSEYRVGEPTCPHCNRDGGGKVRIKCSKCGQINWNNKRKCWNCGQRTGANRGLMSSIFYYIMISPFAFGILVVFVWFFDPFDMLYSQHERASDFDSINGILRNISIERGTYEIAFSNNSAREQITVYTYIRTRTGDNICPTAHRLSRSSEIHTVECQFLKFYGGLEPYRGGLVNRPEALPDDASEDYSSGSGRGRVKGFR